MDVVIVTGLSGAGKSQAMNCLEDLGYYCIDNMPPALINDFINLSVMDRIKVDKAAFVVDIRGGEFFDDLKNSLADLQRTGMNYKVLFLEASDEVLIRRYSETRRTHPLSTAGATADGIKKEKEKLLEIREISDYIVDTSNMKSAVLKEEIKKLFLSEEETESFTLSIKSFGFKNGMLLDADMVFDVRFIPNPFYLASMKNLTGNSKKVQEYVMRFPESKDFVTRVHGLIESLIPSYMKEGKSHLVIGFGCTGGQHRSVTMANEFSKIFMNEGKRVVTMHRDL